VMAGYPWKRGAPSSSRAGRTERRSLPLEAEPVRPVIAVVRAERRAGRTRDHARRRLEAPAPPAHPPEPPPGEAPDLPAAPPPARPSVGLAAADLLLLEQQLACLAIACLGPLRVHESPPCWLRLSAKATDCSRCSSASRRTTRRLARTV